LPYLKIVRPFADKRSKWRSTCPKHLLHGQSVADIRSFPFIEILTKALKECEVLYEMGISAVATMSESISPESFEVIPEMIDKKYTLVLMDNDEAGRACAKKWEEAGYKTIFVPDEYKAKDISDLVLEIGFENAKKWILTQVS
jgi:5S rRNA maturation endonuclease (ribonuclease M5)